MPVPAAGMTVIERDEQSTGVAAHHTDSLGVEQHRWKRRAQRRSAIQDRRAQERSPAKIGAGQSAEAGTFRSASADERDRDRYHRGECHPRTTAPARQEALIVAFGEAELAHLSAKRHWRSEIAYCESRLEGSVKSGRRRKKWRRETGLKAISQG